jgi:hypothetical protein
VRGQKLPLVQYYARKIRPPGLIGHVTPRPAGGDTWRPSRVQDRRYTCGVESGDDPNLLITEPEACKLLIPKRWLHGSLTNPTKCYKSLTTKDESKLRNNYENDQQDATMLIYCSLSAPRDSSYIFAHHQEHLNCIYNSRPAATYANNTRCCKYS